MSEIFIATPAYTKSKQAIFGQNVSGYPNEGQATVRLPAMESIEEFIQCKYVQVAQVKQTKEILASKTYDDWGIQVGVNEDAVSIGHVKVQPKGNPDQGQVGLTGSELTRIALERASSAKEALSIITGLIEEVGQDAFVSFKEFGGVYSNNFIIADKKGAVILETAGKEWVAKSLKDSFYVVTDTYTIEDEYEWSSENVKNHAIKNKWITDKSDFSFRAAYWKKPRLFGSDKVAKKMELLKGYLAQYEGELSLKDAMNALRLHGGKEESFDPSKSSNWHICKHASDFDDLQTNNSFIFSWNDQSKIETAWITGTSAPCISVFKPFFMPGKNLYEGLTKQPGPIMNDSLWWRAEKFHRSVSVNYKKGKEFIGGNLQDMQLHAINTVNTFIQEGSDEDMFNELSEDSLKQHLKKIMEWEFKMTKGELDSGQFSPRYKSFIEKLNKEVTPSF